MDLHFRDTTGMPSQNEHLPEFLSRLISLNITSHITDLNIRIPFFVGVPVVHCDLG